MRRDDEREPLWREEFRCPRADERYVGRGGSSRSSWCSPASACSPATSGSSPRRSSAGRGSACPEVPVARPRPSCRSAASRLFAYPGPDDPCLLVRYRRGPLGGLQPEVHPPLLRRLLRERRASGSTARATTGSSRCEDGRVLQGPPPRPLPRVRAASDGATSCWRSASTCRAARRRGLDAQGAALPAAAARAHRHRRRARPARRSSSWCRCGCSRRRSRRSSPGIARRRSRRRSSRASSSPAAAVSTSSSAGSTAGCGAPRTAPGAGPRNERPGGFVVTEAAKPAGDWRDRLQGGRVAAILCGPPGSAALPTKAGFPSG